MFKTIEIDVPTSEWRSTSAARPIYPNYRLTGEEANKEPFHQLHFKLIRPSKTRCGDETCIFVFICRIININITIRGCARVLTKRRNSNKKDKAGYPENEDIDPEE